MAIQSVIRNATSFAGSQIAGWTGEQNLLSLDGNCAQSQLTGQNTNAPYLKLSAFDNPVPNDVTVVGISLRITARNQYTSNTGFFAVGGSSGGLRLLGLTGAAYKGMPAFKSNSLSTKVVGGSSDLWGAASIDVSELNDPNCTVYAQFMNGNTVAQSMFIDCIQMEVFYDDGL